MSKFKRSLHFYGFSFPFWFYRKTGVYGMYCDQARHYWFGIKGLIGIRYSVE